MNSWKPIYQFVDGHVASGGDFETSDLGTNNG